MDGDKVLKVDGEDLENVLDINKFLFLRNVSEVRVEHINGKQENISVPENIDEIMFEKGAVLSFLPLRSPTLLDSVITNSNAYKAGLLKGDRIININGTDVAKWDKFSELIELSTSPNLDLKIKRGNKIIDYTVPLDEDNKIGVIMANMNQLVPTEIKYSFIESIHDGFDRAYWELLDYVGQFKHVFTKKGAS